MPEIAPRIVGKWETAVLISMGLVKFLAHFVFNGRYGYFRDELYSIICGHNNYWLWGSGERSGAVLIVIDGKADDCRKAYAEVTEVARTNCEFAMP